MEDMSLHDYLRHFGNSNPSDFRSAVAAEEAAVAFERALAKLGIPVRGGSNLERIILNMFEAAEWQRAGGLLRLNQVDPEAAAERLGLELFARKIVRLADRDGFLQFIPHLAMLNDQKCIPSLNVPGASGDVNNKVFELLMGLIAFENGTDFVMDDPRDSSSAGAGKHPDVRVRLDGRRWAIECKSIISPSAFTLFDRLKDAVAQIEGTGADLGVVVFHLRRAVDLGEFWPKDEPGNIWDELFGPRFVSPEYAVQRLHQLITDRAVALVMENGADNVRQLFQGKRALPLILLFVQASAVVQGPRGGMLMGITQLAPAPLVANPPDQAALFEKLNRSLHDIPV